MRKSKRGGARPGAGRPPTGKVALYVYVSPAMREWLELVALKSGATLSTATEVTLAVGQAAHTTVIDIIAQGLTGPAPRRRKKK